jgi:hypothetical protein
MIGRRVIRLAPWVLVALLVAWIASRTAWVEVPVPMPLKGPAAVNPFYAAQRFAEALGVRAEWDRRFDMPETDAVIVASYWNWSLTAGRRDAMKRWVEAGGRLVVDRAFLAAGDDFERWSGIAYAQRRGGAAGPGRENDAFIAEAQAPFAAPPCAVLTEVGGEARAAANAASQTYALCGFDRSHVLTSARRPAWGLRSDAGFEAIRVDVGLGSVTMVNATPFLRRGLFDGDHARIFAAATQLRSGDEIRFLSEDDHPSLLVLTWRAGAPVVLLVAALLALALWRGGVRFGPMVAPTETARRSLAAQIRGTGRFALRFGGGAALHRAAVRALDEAAARRIPGYDGLATEQRIETLARAAGLEAARLAAALGFREHALEGTAALGFREHALEGTAPPSTQSSQCSAPRRRALQGSAPKRKEIASAIALLESARRRILQDDTRSKRGTT